MQKPCVIIYGPTITSDAELIQKLNKHVTIIICLEKDQFEALLETNNVDILLFEITTDSIVNLNIIKTIKRKYPHIEVILIDGIGHRNILARAFASGARDAFPISYNRGLLIERILALLRQI